MKKVKIPVLRIPFSLNIIISNNYGIIILVNKQKSSIDNI